MKGKRMTTYERLVNYWTQNGGTGDKPARLTPRQRRRKDHKDGRLNKLEAK